MLPVSDGNLIYWEASGNPDGMPVVVLHGGPGSGSSPSTRRLFDPGAYRIIQFDQRQCGNSQPHASDPTTDLSTNTTAHLLADMEALRQHLGVERWLLFGGSWGTTLGLAYAECYPHRVSAAVFFGVTTTRPSEIAWLYRWVAPLFPAQWSRFRTGVPEEKRDGDLVEAYYRLLADPDPSVRQQAAADWMAWDTASVSSDPNFKPNPRWADPAFQIARARIVTHYFHHRAWLEDGILLREAGKLSAIPGILVQGRLDLGAPLTTAWELSHIWTASQLVIVENAGHAMSDAGMTEALIVATDHFTKRKPETGHDEAQP
jgi:proline iminopeptidase